MYDTIESMDIDDLKKIAAEKLFYDLNKRQSQNIAKEKSKNKQIYKHQYHFTKVYKTPVRRLVMEQILTTREKAFLFDILAFINRETNVIVDDRGIPMSQEKLMKLCNVGRTTMSEITNKLIKKNILSPIHEGCNVFYKVNKKYFECKKKELGMLD